MQVCATRKEGNGQLALWGGCVRMKDKCPNAWKVAQELAQCKHPEKVLSALTVLLASNLDIFQITVEEVEQGGQ